jgi:hypothetical protein
VTAQCSVCVVWAWTQEQRPPSPSAWPRASRTSAPASWSTRRGTLEAPGQGRLAALDGEAGRSSAEIALDSFADYNAR